MKTALVTGGAGGIGSAICKKLAQSGCQVAVHYNTKKDTAEALAEQLQKSFGVKAMAVWADVADRESVNSMFDKVDNTLGGVDILVNNAGIAQQKLFTDITANDWRSMLDTNLGGVFNCSQEVLRRHMIPGHSGVILNISSMWGQVGASCEVHYSAAKAGVIGLTKALAKEVGLSGVRVNCIAPGVIMTDMMKGFDEETIQALREETPLNTLGTPDDIAEAAVFLCSDKARFITGQVLGVNGGFVIL
ncbi:elongation factor P 5-aminopentanone reductase [Lachnoclostridium sp. MSJ-17]|uniref:elongation factor P 5-aminopentanone reductase n=1 Tax=Lachnoclostridium sp. MSJ-17 TaxID=2841516 RepID=UPI001C0FE120|nr:3-oxoacyl-ACP reductase FabG [Lachnoclostridium sp. MSJ-17]MBU5461682.1 3-oxoacyl-ACP reductase FabG [Lachnoclostridium sp. MSJ-17]